MSHHPNKGNRVPKTARTETPADFYPTGSALVDLSHLSLTSLLADLPTYDFAVSSSTPDQVVAREFEQQPQLPGVIITENGVVVGAFSRRKFLERVGQLYGVEVYLIRPIRVMLRSINAVPLQLPSSMPIHQAAQLALSRSNCYSKLRPY